MENKFNNNIKINTILITKNKYNTITKNKYNNNNNIKINTIIIF